ncbi:UNVERIFIED_CONTAM: hypothetical protein K2H54_036019 [Gekko kuhli]
MWKEKGQGAHVIRMRQALKEFSNLLLVVLCDYVLGAMEYLLLEQPTHVALSNSTISLEFRHYYDGNVTVKNVSILLLEAGTNQTLAKKQLSQNQFQDIVVFECCHFKSVGSYWFRMVSEISNSTNTWWNEESLPLVVKWPEFHIDIRRTSERLGNSLQLGLFTSEYLCPMNKTVISLDVILTSSLYDLGKLISDETVGLRTHKELSLSRYQWVTVDCHVVGRLAYVAALLKPAKKHSIIASMGPVDLEHRFGYKIIVTQETMSTKSTPISTLYPEGGQGGNNNLVTITGISLCLTIIFATILITLWRKLCKAQKCSTPGHCDSAHSPSCRKNSDEENICQERQPQESFSEGGEDPCSESLEIPLNFRRSLHFAQEEEGGEVSENVQANAQKIIPPIFSYRLAQQQLKEMKKKGLTETTKVYHVSPNPLTDTSTENQEATATANKFRIKSPFLEQSPNHLNIPGGDFTLPQSNPILSPSQSLIRHLRYQSRGEQLGTGYPRCSQFRRTASFHEARKAKPFRKRSMSTLPPRQALLYPCQARKWDRVPEEQHQPKSKEVAEILEEFHPYHSTASANEPLTWEPSGKKQDLDSSRQPAPQVLCVERPEQKRNKKVPFQNHRDIWRKEIPILAVRENQQRTNTLSPVQYRRSKCQSFPSDPKYHFYDNTSFGLTESELQIIDLPGYFGPNEGGETSTLSIEKLML